MARSLNKVELIGNLTRDPELRYTPAGAAVCTFGLATNRSWNTESGEKKEEAEFHRIVAWNKLAELCSQLLAKGRKIYVEGRLQTRRWSGQDGVERVTTEIVIQDMIILDSKNSTRTDEEFDVPEDFGEEPPSQGTQNVSVKSDSKSSKKGGKTKGADKAENESSADEPASDDDIPF